MPLDSLWNKGPQQHPSSELDSGWSSLARPMLFRRLLSRLCGVCFGRPTLRFPCGFQSRACLVMLDAGFHSVWPIQPHLRFLICLNWGLFVLSHSCSFETNVQIPYFLAHYTVTDRLSTILYYRSLLSQYSLLG